MSSSRSRSRHAPVLIGFSAVLLLIGLAVFCEHLWRSHQHEKAIAEVAHRYVTFMHSGRCDAAQLLTIFPGSAAFCAKEGLSLADLSVSCVYARQRADQHYVDCNVDSSSVHRELLVLLVLRNDRMLVVDAIVPSGEGPP